MRIALAIAFLACGFGCRVSEPAQSQSPTAATASQPVHLWRRAYTHRGRDTALPERKATAVVAASAPQCPDAKPLTLYRFIDGIDNCMQQMSQSDIAALGDPFAVNVLAKGIGNSAKWPTSVETVVSLTAAVPNFGANQKNYMLGEGSQITTAVAPRDASRNLRYVITWGANASPTVFLSAAPTGTHPGKPASFLQVIGYDSQKNVFNYYEFVSNPGQPTRTWSLADDSTNARNLATAGRGCMGCHINGALNMKELVPPWNNWNSPAANISPGNIPATVVSDPLYAAPLTGADLLQSNFQNVQSRYSQGLVGAAITISDGTVRDVPMLLRRLITTTTVNFSASNPTPESPNTVQVPTDFFLQSVTLGVPQINLSFAAPSSFTIPKNTHDAFVAANAFALQQLNGSNQVVYRQAGTNFFPLFMPVSAFEDRAVIQQLINQKVIDANFAASVLLVDFPNPIFSARRESLVTYANQIQTAQLLSGSGANPNAVPAQFIARVQATSKNQPACDTAKLLQCSPEQQFLFYAGQRDWQQRAKNQVNPYLAAVVQRLGTDAGANDYLTLWASRQAQFAAAPVIGNFDEFALLLPCNQLTFNSCKRMNPDGTISDDPQSNCSAQTCVQSP
jgi:hypothetical protein